MSDTIYVSTPYPADKVILFHNESSHLSRWPTKIFFCCLTAAQQGGETPVVDCRKVYKLLDPSITERFKRKGLVYVRNFKQGLDVSWETFFRTADRLVVERLCRAAAIDFQWTAGGELRIRKARPAVAKHPVTGETAFFNQLLLHHISCLEPAERASLLALFNEEDVPRNVYYGDYSPIEDSVVDEIREVYRELAVSFPWEEGDVLLLDNMLTAHGRNTFSGPRKIAVALGDMVGEEENPQGGGDGQ
jgi:alpha-ketoglutarate-dependent taurine dioxygenase